VLEIGHYRMVLHPGADPAALEAKLAGGETGVVLQLTRVTSSVTPRLLRRTEPGSDHELSREYVYEVSVQLVVDEMGYRFAENLEPLQAAVADVATVIGVDVFAAVAGSPHPVREPGPEA
jgi:hypothetical protein